MSTEQNSIIEASEMRRWLPQPLRNWDERFILYYDETNNIRRLTLSEVGLNVPDHKVFVLAGIVLRPGTAPPRIDDLRKSLRVQDNARELKAKHVAEGDFEAMLASPQLRTFLSWLLDHDLLVHYSALNVLYWSLIDIVESLQGQDAMVPVHHRKLKNELYDLVTRDRQTFLHLLHGFSYPNISRAAIRPFLTAVVQFLESQSPTDRNLAATLLKHRLRAAAALDDLPFLHDNEEGELIADFSGHFLRSLYVFKNATHVFDRETFVERALRTTEVCEGSRRLDYRFADSKAEVGVQVSDVVASLFGKYFTHLQDNALPVLLESKSRFSQVQRANLALLRELVDCSDAVSDGFCHTVLPLDTGFKNDAFLHERRVPDFLYQAAGARGPNSTRKDYSDGT